MRRAPWLLALLLLAGCEPEESRLLLPGSPAEPPPAPSSFRAAPLAASSAPDRPASAPPSAPDLPAASASAAPARPHLYATWKRLPLTLRQDRFEGELRLLEDALVTRRGAVRDAPSWLGATEVPLPARLELVNDRGEVIASEEFDRPLADLEAVQLRGDGRPTYQLTVDYSCGMGSYCGPVTSFFEVEGPALRRVQATDEASHRSSPLSFLRSLKTAWRKVPARSGQGFDLLEIKCRPSQGFWQVFARKMQHEEPDLVFLTAYSRYSFEGGAWVKRWMQKKEYRDLEDGNFRPFFVENGHLHAR
jgi:hypothetical protein